MERICGCCGLVDPMGLEVVLVSGCPLCLWCEEMVAILAPWLPYPDVVVPDGRWVSGRGD